MVYVVYKGICESYIVYIYIIVVVILGAFFVGITGCSYSGSRARESDARRLKSIGLMPLNNVSGSLNVPDDIMYIFRRKIMNIRPDLKVVPVSKVEKFLLEHRIRWSDSLNVSLARLMGKVLKIDAAVIVTVNLYVSDSENPEIGLSSRAISCLDGSIIWAKTVSLSGEDFKSWFGSGEINSMEELMDMGLEELAEDLSQRIQIGISKLKPFELVYVRVFPTVVKSEGEVKVYLKILPIYGKLQSVKVVIANKSITMKSIGGNRYEGEFISPEKEKRYMVKVVALDEGGMEMTFDSVAVLVVDNTPPKVTISFQSEILSPNGDGIMDKVILFPRLAVPDVLKDWELQIANNRGEIVRIIAGQGDVPQGLVWHGEDDLYYPVGDGDYYCRLIVHDQAGNEFISPTKHLIVDRSSPTISVVFKDIKKKLLFLQ